MGLSIDKFRYFSHDADMRNDIKVRALRRKFGNTGYAVWCFILETLTDKDDLEIEYTPVDIELLAADFDVTAEELQEIIQYCVKINLLQLVDERLFSARHQERIKLVLQRKAYKSEIAKKAIAARWNKEYEQSNNDSNTDVIQSNNDSNTIRRGEEIREEKIRGEKKDILPYGRIVELWNSTCVNLPRVNKLSDARRQKIKCRLEELGGKKDISVAVDNLTAILQKVAQSDFLNGSNNSNWTASFDWLFDNSKNWIKVSEGNYDNKRGAKSAPVSGANNLGVGEYIDNTGKRTYGTGKANIPMSAPPRPSDSYTWNESSKTWIML